MTKRVLPLLVALTTLVSCGDPLVEGTYRGQPLISISGTIRVTESLDPGEADGVRVALLWAHAGQHSDINQGRSASEFPARYTLDVYSLPPARAMSEFEDRNGLWALARIVLYVDADGDNRLGAGERIVGAAPDEVLAYFTSSERTTLVRGSILTGYQVMTLLSCDDRLDDKAMLQGVASSDTVDLTLQQGVASELSDLDCDQISDEFCFDLQIQIGEDPDNEELRHLFAERCEFEFDPTFNNENPEDREDPDKETPTNNDGVPDCDQDPGSEGCDGTEPDPPNNNDNSGDPSGEPGVCRPLLDFAIDKPSYEQQAQVYWQFAQCAERNGPCEEVQWEGDVDRFLEYRGCIFEWDPGLHREYCGFVAEARMADGDSGEFRAFYEMEWEYAACEQIL